MATTPGPGERIEGSGRKPGKLNRSTELIRAGMKSAMEIVREGGNNPMQVMTEAYRYMRNISIALGPQGNNPEELTKATRDLASTPEGRKLLELHLRFMSEAVSTAYKCAEFGYAKLSRMEWVGDAPQLKTENKMVFVLNIDHGEAPGRPVGMQALPPSNGHDAEETVVIEDEE